MASALAGDDLVRTLSNRSLSRRSIRSASTRSWASASIREAWASTNDVFQKSSRKDDEEELKWAAIEKLPTYDRLRKGLLKQILEDGGVQYEEVDIANLGLHDKRHLMDNILKVVEDDNEKFLHRLRDRTDRMTLLLGPPGAGKTTLLQSLAGKRDKDLRVALGDSNAFIQLEDNNSKSKKLSSSIGQHKTMPIEKSSESTVPQPEGIDMAVMYSPGILNIGAAGQAPVKTGMVLPFPPLSLAFDHVNYYVDMPAQIPIWWRWYYWASPVAWTIYGLVTSQIGDIDDPVEVPGRGSTPVKQYLKDNLGFDYNFLGAVVAAHRPSLGLKIKFVKVIGDPHRLN
ncbi:hypothetical protein RJ641_005301 [Dillenia turbinata]|uniref:ABC-transporter N-terminal domain-containing protein n=1 Tax=Dillenia turbinata TaxID=194707 RepID=A0AAN8VFU6_9MAGN